MLRISGKKQQNFYPRLCFSAAAVFSEPDYRITVFRDDDPAEHEILKFNVEVQKLSEGEGTASVPASDEIEDLSADLSRLSIETPSSFSLSLSASLAQPKIEIPGIGKTEISPCGTIIFSESDPLISGKNIEISTDHDIALDSINLQGLNLNAKRAALFGDCRVKDLSASVAENFSVADESSLTLENIGIFGDFLNFGTLNFRGSNAEFSSDESNFLNYGTVSGAKFSLKNFGAFLNYRKIVGQQIDFSGNFFSNSGIVGSPDTLLNFLIYKSLLNKNHIAGSRANVVIPTENGNFLNDEDANFELAGADLKISGTLENRGSISFGNLSGFAGILLNGGEFNADRGALLLKNFGENRHVLKLDSLISEGEFRNFSGDRTSKMSLRSLSGNGKFFNTSYLTLI